MFSDPMTLYKLMILYLLKKVNFPLNNAQLGDFFLQREYTTYFTLQEAISELVEAGLIHSSSTHSTTSYEITQEGEDTLTFFQKNISPAIVEDMDQYIKDNRFRLRNEMGISSDYYKSASQDYTVHCEVREGKETLIDLSICVPDKDQAQAMSERWRTHSQEIYAYVMKTLMSEDD